ncbi:rod shape-determining protein MreD [Tropicimonas aquimaris]|uniref:Rod shape-determining protein MreD n=1 Tax=Tropicimonas aquimaris TaxID=914152 RepID=A0ABW3IS03_9RHOB
MVDPITTRTWGYRLLYTAVILVIAFIQLLPIGIAASNLPGPDLALAVTFAWVLRRPSYVPVLLVAALFMFLDLLLQQPPGLGTALAVLGTEVLRSRKGVSRDLPFPVEWVFVTGVMVALVGLNQIVLTVAMTDRPPLGLALLRALFTAGVYPFVVALSHYGFRVSAADPNEADALGSRL